jgi:hypothetical protein
MVREAGTTDPRPPAYPYGEPLIDMPDGAELRRGDIVWQRPDGRFVVTAIDRGDAVHGKWLRVFSIG